jgi:hypothetical protein
MRSAGQWDELQSTLEDDWDEVTLAFVPEDASAAANAASVLAPLQPGRVGNELRLHVTRRGAGTDRLANVLRRLDQRRVWGALRLVDSRSAPAAARTEAPPKLAEAWGLEVAKLPPGWRDAYVELRLDSSDFLPRAALDGAPLNPTRVPDESALRFRVGNRGGYGAAPEMTRRALERMDEDGITGRVRILHVLSDTDDVHTQGPVWRLAGRSV